MKQENIVPAVMMAIKIIDLLVSKPNRVGLSLKTISEELSMNKSTTLRILRTLESEDLVNFYQDSKTYSLGHRFVSIGKQAEQLNLYIDKIRDLLDEVAEPEITYVIVNRTNNYRLRYLIKGDSLLPVSLNFRRESFPIPFGSPGKCFFAFMNDEEKEVIFSRLANMDDTYATYNFKVEKSREDWEQELDLIRKQGYAISIREHFDGLETITYPILDDEGNPIYGVSAYMLKLGASSLDMDVVRRKLETITHKIKQILKDANKL